MTDISTPEKVHDVDVAVVNKGTVPRAEIVQDDYFGFDEERTFMFPDGVTFVTFKLMNEGDRKNYARKTNKDLRVQKGGDAFLSINQVEDKHALIEVCVTGWNLVRAGKPMSFSKQNLATFLTLASPLLIDDLAQEINDANPWLLGDVELEDLDKEIERLEGLKKAKQAEDDAKND